MTQGVGNWGGRARGARGVRCAGWEVLTGERWRHCYVQGTVGEGVDVALRTFMHVVWWWQAKEIGQGTEIGVDLDGDGVADVVGIDLDGDGVVDVSSGL